MDRVDWFILGICAFSICLGILIALGVVWLFFYNPQEWWDCQNFTFWREVESALTPC